MKLETSNDAWLLHYITTENCREAEALFEAARETRRRSYKNAVFFRGLIEFTNHCKNDCYYCGIRRSNRKLERHRLTVNEILQCCRQGDALGYQTFVLQGGEDPWFTDERIVELVRAVLREFPRHAITLSIGERSRQSYEAFFNAGANR